MVEQQLTNEMIAAGAALIRKLDEHGVQPDAAFWFYLPDIKTWKLVIAEVKVGRKGPKEVYSQIKRMLEKFSEEIKGLSLDEITLLKPDARIVALMRLAIRTPPDAISEIRFTHNVINGTLIEDAYIYRLSSSK